MAELIAVWAAKVIAEESGRTDHIGWADHARRDGPKAAKLIAAGQPS